MGLIGPERVNAHKNADIILNNKVGNLLRPNLPKMLQGDLLSQVLRLITQ